MSREWAIGRSFCKHFVVMVSSTDWDRNLYKCKSQLREQ